MKIIHISAECYPIAKVGGLADVVGSLPKYQNNQDIDAAVIMPFYLNNYTKNNSFKTLYKSKIILGTNRIDFEVKTLENNRLGFEVFFISIPDLLSVDYVYSSDDAERFIAFQIAVLNWMLSWKDKPDIVHCHDHHTGLIPFMMTQSFAYDSLKAIPTILTIHNAQYQGWFSYDYLPLIPEFNHDHIGLLDWDHQINSLAAAIKCAWRVTTVSPSYMDELKENANGLETLLQHESNKCIGILNGIDTDVWDPETDSFINKNYVSRIVQSGKKANKKYLCKRFNLDSNKPLFVFIGRLVGEKGADLLAAVFKILLEKGASNILLLGSGYKETEQQLQQLTTEYQGSFNAFIGYDEQLSHNMYAGADFLLMPSRVEPCGLNQMYALRYGTIPVVRKIGGLKDTVVDIANNDGFGILHNEVSVSDMVFALQRAEKLYEDIPRFKKIRKKIMHIDHSWDASAAAYISLYKSIK